MSRLCALTKTEATVMLAVKQVIQHYSSALLISVDCLMYLSGVINTQCLLHLLCSHIDATIRVHYTNTQWYLH
jgi:hypothetical protein